jgi:hypothetical protein
MCYCDGYNVASDRLGERAHEEREDARANYTLRKEAGYVHPRAADAYSGGPLGDGYTDWYTMWLNGRRGVPLGMKQA